MDDKPTPTAQTVIASPSLRDMILGARLPSERVTVPEWGGAEVELRGLSAGDRDEWESGLQEVKVRNGKPQVERNRRTVRASLVQMSLFDPATGQRVYKRHEIGVLEEQPAAIIDRLFAIAQRLSGISQADEEDLAKN